MMAGYVAFTGTDELTGWLPALCIFIYCTQHRREMFVDFPQRAHNKKSGQKANYFLDERAFLK